LEHCYDQLITIDADGQHLPGDVPRLFDALPGADVVSGTRFHPQSPEIGTLPAWRLLANQAVAEMVRRHTGYSITDGACGLRAYWVSALSQLRITEAGYAVPFELWGQMARSGLVVSEVPVTRIYMSEGQPRPPDPQMLEQMIIMCERVLLRELRGESRLAFFSRLLKNASQCLWRVLKMG